MQNAEPREAPRRRLLSPIAVNYIVLGGDTSQRGHPHFQPDFAHKLASKMGLCGQERDWRYSQTASSPPLPAGFF
jgi:hypothetical protein